MVQIPAVHRRIGVLLTRSSDAFCFSRCGNAQCLSRELCALQEIAGSRKGEGGGEKSGSSAMCRGAMAFLGLGRTTGGYASEGQGTWKCSQSQREV